MSAAVRIAVLGTGRIGAMHAELLAHRVEGARLAAVYDAEPERARSVAAELGVDAAASAEELYASPDVDAIAICSSTDVHVEEMVAAAGAGKAIFCEKPLSLDLDELDRGLEAVGRAGVLFQVGFNRRFDPAHQSVRDAVAAGTIGDVHVVRITSRDPAPPPAEYAGRSGGLFLDTTIHDFDMARYVTGSEVVEVFARGATRLAPGSGELDTAVVTLVHDDGAFTVIDNSRRALYGYDQRVEAFGSLGMAASENPLAHTGLTRTAAGTHASTLPYFFLERYIPSYVREWEAFVQAFRAGLTSPVGAADGRAPLVIGLAAGLSHREGRPVRVDEIG
ncbi:MAG TPA: inositol 2-dehydrogenase [Gaiellaceae bacterium]|nr:inositol 2-dehydrogenase [Gaiellaceae bacterium]